MYRHSLPVSHQSVDLSRRWHRPCAGIAGNTRPTHSNSSNAREPMSRKDPVNWMLSEAIDSLARAERLGQQFFSLQPTPASREPSWEPPIDVLETDREVLILVALPGVDPDQVDAVIEDGILIISGRRVLP